MQSWAFLRKTQEQPNSTTCETWQARFMKQNGSKPLDPIYSLLFCLKQQLKVSSFFLFSLIILLTRRKNSWVRWGVLSSHMEEKNGGRKTDHRSMEKNHVEEMVVMKNRSSVTVISLSIDNFFQTGCDKYLWLLQPKVIYFSVCFILVVFEELLRKPLLS